jgi:hypothetical protein
VTPAPLPGLEPEAFGFVLAERRIIASISHVHNEDFRGAPASRPRGSSLHGEVGRGAWKVAVMEDRPGAVSVFLRIKTRRTPFAPDKTLRSPTVGTGSDFGLRCDARGVFRHLWYRQVWRGMRGYPWFGRHYNCEVEPL